MTARTATRGRRWLTSLALNVLLVVGSVVVAVLLTEVVVRIAGIGSDQLLRPDPVLGVRFIESKTGLSQGSCYKADVAINADGWRSRDVSIVKPQDVYRVLVLGDSFMAGVQVDDDKTFSSVLERQLNGMALRQRVEVINFGVPSWGTDQQYLSLREYGLRLDPDLVLLAFYAQNDVDENSSALRSATNTYPKPYFDVKDGRLVELPFSDSTPALIGFVRERVAPFRIYPLIRDALLTMPAVHRVLYQLGIVGVVPQEQSSGSESSRLWQWPDRWRRQLGVYRREYPLERNHAWAITEALLGRIRAEVTRGGGELLLMGVSSPVEVMPASVRSGLVADGQADSLDVDKPSKLLAQLAARSSIDFFSLLPGFRERIGDSVERFEEYYLNCDGHWTPAGHQLAAELVAPKIAARVAQADQ